MPPKHLNETFALQGTCERDMRMAFDIPVERHRARICTKRMAMGKYHVLTSQGVRAGVCRIDFQLQ